MTAERAPLRIGPAAPPPQHAVGAWLDLFQSLLRMPEGVAASIREELESHLRERVRDLMLEGVPEAEAIRHAVLELGDAASLARRFRAARVGSRRRMLMNIGVCAAIVVGGVIGVSSLSRPDTGDRIAVLQVAPAEPPPEALLKEIRMEVGESPLAEVFTMAEAQLKMPIRVAWRSLVDFGIDASTAVSLDHAGTGFDRFLGAVSDSLGAQGSPALASRVEDGRVVVATEDYFDRREIQLVRYEVSRESSRLVADLIQKFVHTDGWDVNGGDLARLEVVGSKLFVRAPKRYHAEVRWFIDEMQGWDDAAAQHSDEVAVLQRRIQDLERDRLAVRDWQAAKLKEFPGSDPLGASPSKPPSPLSADAVSSLTRSDAMREWALRKKAAANPDTPEDMKRRLLDEADACLQRVKVASDK